jgi:hypothetical protein
LHGVLIVAGGYLFFEGTFAPFLRASLRPIAIACFRLVTFFPEPLLSVPFLRRRMVRSTFFDADLPYLAMIVVLPFVAKLMRSRLLRSVIALQTCGR